MKHTNSTISGPKRSPKTLHVCNGNTIRGHNLRQNCCVSNDNVQNNQNQ